MGNQDIFLHGIVALHSLLRWLIILLLVLNITRSFISADTKKYTGKDATWNLRLMLVMHLNLVFGFVQYFFGDKGFAYFSQNTMSEVMSNSFMRFWAIEHPLLMLSSIALITYSRKRAKAKTEENVDVKHKKLGRLYILSLVLILLAIPWPIREIFQDYPWFRLLY